MKKILKIISCTGPYSWYKDKIGEQFEVKFMDNPKKHNFEIGTDEINTELINNQLDYVVDMCNSRGDLGSICYEDAEIFEVEDSVKIRDFEKIPTETETIRTELEMTQNALNKILMNQLGGM